MNNQATSSNASNDMGGPIRVGADHSQEPVFWNPRRTPPPNFAKLSEIRSNARNLTQKIFDNWDLLQHIVQRHELTFQRRWVKKSNVKRRDVLLSAWPGMSQHHRPDLEAFRKAKVGKEAHEACMWPYINLEDLSKTEPLCLMINARGRNPPSAFAMADSEHTFFGTIKNMIEPSEIIKGYSMVFTGRLSRDTYGELVSWEDEPDSIKWLDGGTAVYVVQGLRILEVQDRLYRFLVDVSKGILHDITAESLMASPIQPEPPLLSANTAADHMATLATTALEVPYRLPANLDFSRLRSIIDSRLSAAEDHIWSLREDPGYFAAALEEHREHGPEVLLPDARGHAQSYLHGSRDPEVWHRSIGRLIIHALVEVTDWHILLEKMTRLAELEDNKYSNGQIQPGVDIPHDYSMAFYALYVHLLRSQSSVISVLRYGWYASPPMRQHVRVELDPFPTRVHVKCDKDRSIHKILRIMDTLFHEDDLASTGLGAVMDEIEHLVKKEPAARQFISSWVADQLGVLSIVSECVRQLDLYQPWAASFESGMIDHKDEIDADYLQCLRKPGLSLHLTSLGMPTDGRFKYPAGKPRTKANTDTMRKAENALDAFWAQVEKELTEAGGLMPRLQSVFSRPVQRTPEWVAPVKTQDGPVDVGSDPSRLAAPLGGLYIDDNPQTPALTVAPSTAAPPSKSKLKTRGIVQPSPESDSTPEGRPVEQQPEAAQQTTAFLFEVDTRVAKVFRTLFYDPSSSAPAGDIPWSEFLFAMGSIGFAVEKMQGSVWRFSPPSGLDVDRSILFHEPHPGSRLPFYLARRIGRRLSRAYGWTGETFVVALL